jgi:hypothetical protein
MVTASFQNIHTNTSSFPGLSEGRLSLDGQVLFVLTIMRLAEMLQTTPTE